MNNTVGQWRRTAVCISLSCLCLTWPHAATADDPILKDKPNLVAPASTVKKQALRLPASMPPIAPFEQMTRIQIGSTTGQTFGADTKSLIVDGRAAMIAIGVKSSGGAVTTGYYAFQCIERNYRLMAYPAKQVWQPSSARTKWREVYSLVKRPPQFPAVFEAVCNRDSQPVTSPQKLHDRLTTGRRLGPNQ